MRYSDLPDIASKIEAAPPPIPMSRKVGVEVETENNPSTVADALRFAGLAASFGDSYSDDDDDRYEEEDMEGVCEYHCRSDKCGRYLVHPTSDCTISGIECVIGGPNGTAVDEGELHYAVEKSAEIMRDKGARTSTHCGGHVHVDRSDLNYLDHERLLDNIYAVRDELSLLMAAGYRSGIRDDQGEKDAPLKDRFKSHGMDEQCFKDSHGSRGYWVWFTSYETVEFRGWNSTLRAWRLIMSLYVSAALVESAKDGRMAVSSKILDLIGDYLPHYIRLCVKKQMAYMRGGSLAIDSRPVPQLVRV